MKKIRSFLAIVVLVVALSGSFFLQASGSMASAAIHRAGSSFAAGQTTRAVAVRPLGPCPVVGSIDC
jgi:hypothetical protein